MESSESHIDPNNVVMKHSKRGGWTTLPFILGSIFGLTISVGGWLGNLIVYLITKYNVKSIDATQVNNVVLGCSNFFPILGAIISDSCYGPFPVITFFLFISVMSATLMTLTSTFHSLRPPQCINMALPCESASPLQYGFLYLALGLGTIGIGGTRFTIAAMGADQFDDPNDRSIYFNWYFCVFYVATAVSNTALIYIQDNVSWTLGFVISVVSSVIGLILFLSGKKFYQYVKPQGSPLTDIARVIVAAVKKRRVSSRDCEYNYDINDTSTTIPSNSFKFLNCAAIKTESDGLNSRSWSLSTVQEVEDLKILIRIMPLWSAGVLLSALIGMITNFAILQALAMDRHLGHSHFKIPAASFLFFNTLATSVSLSILDRLIYPMWRSLTGRPLTPLQQTGCGHVFCVLALVSAALIEVQRLRAHRAHPMGSENGATATTVAPLSALWLIIPLTFLGISEGLVVSAQVSLFYQEFPTSLRSTSTAMISLIIASGLYLSTGITSLIRSNTGWLTNDINKGRMDNVYWMLAVIGSVNFGYFCICAKMFKQKVEKHDLSVAAAEIS